MFLINNLLWWIKREFDLPFSCLIDQSEGGKWDDSSSVLCSANTSGSDVLWCGDSWCLITSLVSIAHNVNPSGIFLSNVKQKLEAETVCSLKLTGIMLSDDIIWYFLIIIYSCWIILWFYYIAMKLNQ